MQLRFDQILMGEPPDSRIRHETQWLKDRIEYRRGYELYHEGRYAEAREVLAPVAEHGVDAGVKPHAESLVILCDRRLARR